MATGERKWASSSTRRGGMTVLGKVSVPKPINLPSQKLENHGMDPNVEIVPKGTLSWGSRSSSPASNPWGSSPLSFNTDNGRPLSGGSGTRPSTGGSEKAYESTSNAWGSNSRPSSASGSLTSNQASGTGTTLRPRSADTRPGSSQLSRFADPSTENSGAWAAAGSGDNVGHSKDENFSLASGDFPTLGSEKEDPPKNAHSSPQGNDAEDNARINNDNLDHGRRDNPPYQDGRRPIMEKWNGDALQRNPNMPAPPQHFAPWHGAPMGNPPVGVWYSGPPGGPPYVPPGAPPYGTHVAPPYGPSGGPPFGPSNIPPYGPLMGPGGFPVEHPYYHPPMPAPSLGSSQPVPHHGAGSRGGHQNNGDMYRPSNPDGHFRPCMPMRPGFFPGPVPYEGYYPPPIGYCGPNDRDIPYLGPAGAPVYDGHSTPNAPEHTNSQHASGRHGTHEKPTGLDQGISGHRHNPREQYKVLLKQHGEDHEWGDSAAANDSQFEKGYRQMPSSHEKDQGTGSNSDDKNFRRTSNEGEPIHGSHSHGGSQFHGRDRLTDEAKSTKGVSNVEKNISDKVSSSENVAASKDSGLMKRIEGLNAKARGTDGKQDAALYSNRYEGKSRPHVISSAPHVNNESTTHYKSHGGGIIDPPSSHGILAGGGLSSSRKYSNRGPQIKTDYHGKGKPDVLETEGRHNNSHNGHFSTAVSFLKSGPVNLNVQDHQTNLIAGKPESSLAGKDIVSDSGSASDPVDIQAQRAKKKEIAMQRAIQLQREEEERIKEQKAKAQAKLEELNRRSKLLESSTEKVELGIEKAEIVTEKADKTSSVGNINGKQGEAQSEQFSNAAAVLNSNTIVIGTRTLDPQLQIPKDGIRGSLTCPHQSPVEKEGGYHHKIDARGEPHHYGGKNNVLKTKTKGYKDKQNFQHEKVASENIVRAAGDTLKHESNTGEDVFNKVTMLAEPEVHHRAKSDKRGKNKHKVEDTSSSVGIWSVTQKNSDVVKDPVDSGRLQLPKLADAAHGQPQVSSGDLTPSIEPHASQLKEEAQARINNHSRHQSSRKQSRNQQGNRIVEKTHGSDTIVWAAVKQHEKETIKDSSIQVVSEEAGDHIGKSGHAQSNTKNKRAEIERYVPKPVAKDLAHQGGAQQTTSPATNLTGSAATKVETAVENKCVDNHHNRQERAPRALRQRSSAEAFYRKGPKDNTHLVVSRDLHVPDPCEAQEEKKFSDGWNSPDERNASEYKAPVAPVPNLKDQDSFNRVKRQYYKGSRHTGTNVHDHEHRKGQAVKEVDIGRIQITISNSDEGDRTASYKEHCESEHTSSYRQTRQHDLSAENCKTKVGGVHQNSGRENTRFVKRESFPHGDHFQSNTNTRAQVEQPRPVEQQHEQPHSSSGIRKNSNQSNRYVRAQEPQGEWNSVEHDRRHHNQQSSRGRARHSNSHYEYKPKGQSQGQPARASADGSTN